MKKTTGLVNLYALTFLLLADVTNPGKFSEMTMIAGVFLLGLGICLLIVERLGL